MGYSKDLPTDVLLDIITGLPAESILYCKSVCKQWRDLVSHHPLFYRMYLTRRDDFDCGKLSFLVKAGKQLYYFEYNENNDDETPVHSIRRININPPLDYCFYKIVGSSNGLVCLYESLYPAYCIFNSLTREYVMLPKTKRGCDDQSIHYSYGFGYLPLTNEYKVVGKLEFIFPICYAEPGVYANEALHWRDNKGDRILIFDLTVEKFLQPIFPPPRPHVGWGYDYTLGEFGGVLYCVIKYCAIGTHCDVWLYKEKNDNLGMKRLGWSKEFQLSKGKPVAFTKSGGVLCFNGSCLSIYDAKALTWIKLVDLDTWNRQTNQVIPHKNTLVSLKELGEEDVKILESAEIEET